MTPTDRAAIRARLEQATPGPWRISMSGFSVKSASDDMPIVANNPWGSAMSKDAQIEPWLNNAELIAHAPTDLAALLADVERMEQERDAAQAELVEKYRTVPPDKLNVAGRMQYDRAETERARADALAQQVETLRAALAEVMVDAGLEDDYESRDSDGRFIGKAALLAARAAVGAQP